MRSLKDCSSSASGSLPESSRSGAVLALDGAHQVLDLVAAEEEFALDGLQLAFGVAFVTYDVAYVGEAHQHAGAVFISEASLDVHFLEELGIHTGAALHLVGKFVDQIVLFVLLCHNIDIM